MAPFGFMSDGLDGENTFTDDEGTRWFTDEYGDKGGGVDVSNSYMWDYM